MTTMYNANVSCLTQKGGSSMRTASLTGKNQRLLHLMVITLLALGTLAPVASARILHADLGRWLRRDPLGYVDGWNVYEFVKGNPTINTDSNGFACGSGFSEIIPDLVFRKCCKAHDACYGACSGKDTCDAIFLDCMMTRCEKQFIFSLVTCKSLAIAYYGGVQEYGLGAYCASCPRSTECIIPMPVPTIPPPSPGGREQGRDLTKEPYTPTFAPVEREQRRDLPAG